MGRFYIGFDDTDTIDCGRGTGKLARWFCEELPDRYQTWGVVRQQLLHSPEVPMTSHNSALCCVIDAPDEDTAEFLIDAAIVHIKKHFFEGSDPGLCVALASDNDLESLVRFGLRCCERVVTMDEAFKAAKGIHLSGHGGSNGGVIGAAAAVGLTSLGESGRLVSYRDIRELPEQITARDLRHREIHPLSVHRHAEYIPDEDLINTKYNLRPHLSGGRLIIPLQETGKKQWEIITNTKEN